MALQAPARPSRPPIRRTALRVPLSGLRRVPSIAPGTLLSRDATDPRPRCDRCGKRPSDVIVGRAFVPRLNVPPGLGAYLCRQCWGRV